MKQYLIYLLFIAFSIFLSSCSSLGKFERYENVEGKLIETGEASWYGPKFHGRQTANGEIYNQFELTAAHRTLAFGSIVKVVNKFNGKSIIVRINDRGPFAKDRIIDLSRKAAEEINIINSGFADVELYLLNNTTLPKDFKVPHFTVQVGSFKSKSDAANESRKIFESRVVEATIDGGTFYRIYVGNFKSKSDAQNLLDELTQKGINGFVKQVEN
jgi:rare lipoprotein A